MFLIWYGIRWWGMIMRANAKDCEWRSILYWLSSSGKQCGGGVFNVDVTIKLKDTTEKCRMASRRWEEFMQKFNVSVQYSGTVRIQKIGTFTEDISSSPARLLALVRRLSLNWLFAVWRYGYFRADIFVGCLYHSTWCGDWLWYHASDMFNLYKYENMLYDDTPFSKKNRLGFEVVLLYVTNQMKFHVATSFVAASGLFAGKRREGAEDASFQNFVWVLIRQQVNNLQFRWYPKPKGAKITVVSSWRICRLFDWIKYMLLWIISWQWGG